MLNRLRPGSAVLALITAAACTPLPEMEQPVAIEAGYRLLFNDALVGNALFVLQLQPGGIYHLEAFTTPAGQMQRAAGHEVLETSRGVIDREGIRPQRFEHSVMDGERVEMVKLDFDWDGHALRLTDRDRTHTAGLQPQTHDRLSYLLAARRLAAAGEGRTRILIASADAVDDTRLEVIGRQSIMIPLGHYEAIAVSRVTADSDETRELWFDTGFSPLPLRVLHGWDENTVEMQLETFSRNPGHPR